MGELDHAAAPPAPASQDAVECSRRMFTGVAQQLVARPLVASYTSQPGAVKRWSKRTGNHT